VSGVLVSSCALLIRGILTALRQKIHLLPCADFPGPVRAVSGPRREGRNNIAGPSSPQAGVQLLPCAREAAHDDANGNGKHGGSFLVGEPVDADEDENATLFLRKLC
jgi:hypothetical protein